MTSWYRAAPGDGISRRARALKVGLVMAGHLGRLSVVAAAILLLGGAGSVAARAEAAHAAPKVVVIVGPAGAATPYYRTLADQTASAAEKLTPNVVRVYSPDATWERVKAALEGASVVVYLGHGNGWPSIYHDALFPSTEDGFGLNPQAGAADAHQYFGEARIAAEVHLARNAVVVFSHLCYASGNTEPNLPEGTPDQAQQRVDNYAAGFLKAGAGAVIADAYLAPEYYVTSVLRGRSTIDAIWRGAPNRNDHFLTFASTRTKGAVASMDPARIDSGFERSLVIRPRLTSSQVIGGSFGRPGDVEPAQEPTLADRGVTFSAPDLTGTPTTGTTTRLVLPVARDAVGLLPRNLLVSTRWDRLDAPSSAGDPGGTDDPKSADASPSPVADGPSESGAAPSGADVPATAPQLVTAEVPGEVVAPVAAKRLSTGGWSVAVHLPTTPGLYRLVATLHQPDGLAYDAATQALVPALVVRVVGPATAAYRVVPTASVTAGHPLILSVDVSNLGTTAWGHRAGPRSVGPSDVVVAQHATLVARWVPLGAPDETPSAIEDAAAALPSGLGPGATATVNLRLPAPRGTGEYLVVIDLLDPGGASFAANGVAPGIVRVTVSG